MNLAPSFILYEHAKRPHWGPAVVAWERDGKRGYLFQDGTLRVIASLYYSQFELSKVDPAPLARSFQHHLAQLDIEVAPSTTSRGAATPASIAEQVQLFLAEYPGGFVGNAWQAHVRGVAAKRRLKRHRNAAILDARRELDATRLAGLKDATAQQSLWRDICNMLKQTDLVSFQELRQLEERLPHIEPGLTAALGELLVTRVDDSEFEVRFTRLLRALTVSLGGVAPSWSLLTSLLTLHEPEHHVCVYPTSFAQQARAVKEPSPRSKQPNAVDYARALRIANALRQALGNLGVTPVDLIDVCDFMRVTTSPTARKNLKMRRATSTPAAQTRPSVGALSEPDQLRDQAAA